MRYALSVGAVFAFALVVACSSSDSSDPEAVSPSGGGSAGKGTAGAAAGAGGVAGKGTAGQGTSGGGAAGSSGATAGKGGGAGKGTAGTGGATAGSSGGAGKATAGTGGSAGKGTAGSGAGGSNPSDPFDPYRTLCVDTINQYRATKSLPPLDRWTSAEACVDSNAEIDGKANQAHKAFSSGQSCGAYGQNECPGWGTNYASAVPGCLKMMWDEKDKAVCSGCETCEFPYQGCKNCEFQACGHYLNMKSTKFSKVACGFWDGGWYAQNFAQ